MKNEGACEVNFSKQQTILFTITGAVLHDEFAHDADGQSQNAVRGLVQRLIILRYRPGVAIMRTVVTNPVPAHVAQAECVTDCIRVLEYRIHVLKYGSHSTQSLWYASAI